MPTTRSRVTNRVRPEAAPTPTDIHRYRLRLLPRTTGTCPVICDHLMQMTGHFHWTPARLRHGPTAYKRQQMAISTDAHSVNALGFMRFGVDQARRGWITADDVINTRPLGELRKLLRR